MYGQFHAQHLSVAARRAAHWYGLATVESYDRLSDAVVTEGHDQDWDTPVARIYSPRGSSVVVTAGNVYEFSEYQATPIRPARVVPRA